MITPRSLARPPAARPPWRFNRLEIDLILAGVAAAWRRLPAATRARGQQEPPVNEALAAQLDEEIQAQIEPWQQLAVSAVEKGPELTDHRGERLEKRPDVVLRLVGRWSAPHGRHCGAFIECKRIDREHSRRLTHYRSQGIARFVDGRYAWQMATAFMVAYVADGTPLSDLEVSELRTADGVEFGRTEHARAFDVMDAPAGPIELWHAWLRTET